MMLNIYITTGKWAREADSDFLWNEQLLHCSNLECKTRHELRIFPRYAQILFSQWSSSSRRFFGIVVSLAGFAHSAVVDEICSRFLISSSPIHREQLNEKAQKTQITTFESNFSRVFLPSPTMPFHCVVRCDWGGCAEQKVEHRGKLRQQLRGEEEKREFYGLFMSYRYIKTSSIDSRAQQCEIVQYSLRKNLISFLRNIQHKVVPP